MGGIVKKGPNCYVCVHRREVPGDAHSKCNNPSSKVKGDKHGIEKGWFMWPVNFDPAWLEACTGFSNDPKDKKEDVKYSPLLELLVVSMYR